MTRIAHHEYNRSAPPPNSGHITAPQRVPGPGQSRHFATQRTTPSRSPRGRGSADRGGIHARFRLSDPKIEPLSTAVRRAEHYLLRFGSIIACEREVFHEEVFGYATRSRHSFRRPIIGGYARVRVRRLWSEPSSQQCVGPMHMGRSKSSLVPETYGSSCRSYAQRNVGLHQVITFGAARRPRLSLRQPQPEPGWAMSQTGQVRPSRPRSRRVRCSPES
jgi:hypothetical protein